MSFAPKPNLLHANRINSINSGHQSNIFTHPGWCWLYFVAGRLFVALWNSEFGIIALWNKVTRVTSSAARAQRNNKRMIHADWFLEQRAHCGHDSVQYHVRSMSFVINALCLINLNRLCVGWTFKFIQVVNFRSNYISLIVFALVHTVDGLLHGHFA